MLSAWTQHLKDDPEAKQKFEDYVKNSSLLIKRLNDMIDSIERDLGRSETSADVFNTPNWDYLQAYKNGYRSALDTFRLIISLDPKSTNGPST
jgi:lipoprotein NlpI